MSTRRHAESILALLASRGESVSVAESVTGGGLGHALTQLPGSSEVFFGGIIAYTNTLKTDLLAVDPELIAAFTEVSEEVANAMADGVRKACGTTWGIATTGIAGPGDYRGIAEGTVWVSVRGPINQAIQLKLDSGRDAIRTGAISSAIGTFSRILTSRKQS